MSRQQKRLAALILLGCMGLFIGGCGNSGPTLPTTFQTGGVGAGGGAYWAAAMGIGESVTAAVTSGRPDAALKPLADQVGLGWAVDLAFHLFGDPEPSFEEQVLDALAKMQEDLAEIKEELTEVHKAVTDLAKQLERARAELSRRLTEDTLNRDRVRILNVYTQWGELIKKIDDDWENLSDQDRSMLRDEAHALMMDEALARQDMGIPDCMFRMHFWLTGGIGLQEGMLMDITQELIAAKDAPLLDRYNVLASYFGEVLAEEARGLAVTVEALNYRRYRTAGAVQAQGYPGFAEDFLKSRYRPCIEAQIDRFLYCVEKLVVSECNLEPWDRDEAFLPPEAGEIFEHADLFAAQVCASITPEKETPGHTFGIICRFVGEPCWADETLVVNVGKQTMVGELYGALNNPQRVAMDRLPEPAYVQLLSLPSAPDYARPVHEFSTAELYGQRSYLQWLPVEQDFTFTYDGKPVTINEYSVVDAEWATTIAVVKYVGDSPEAAPGDGVHAKIGQQLTEIGAVDYVVHGEGPVPYSNITYPVRHGPRALCRLDRGGVAQSTGLVGFQEVRPGLWCFHRVEWYERRMPSDAKVSYGPSVLPGLYPLQVWAGYESPRGSTGKRDGTHYVQSSVAVVMRPPEDLEPKVRLAGDVSYSGHHKTDAGDQPGVALAASGQPNFYAKRPYRMGASHTEFIWKDLPVQKVKVAGQDDLWVLKLTAKTRQYYCTYSRARIKFDAQALEPVFESTFQP